MSEDVAHHVEWGIRRTKIHTEPFPHAIIDSALPPMIFDHLLKALPAPTSFTSLDRIGFGSVTKYSRRGAQRLSELTDSGPVWMAIELGLSDPAVESALRATFMPFVDAGQMARLRRPLRRELWIDCDLARSSLSPHTDAPSLFVKCIVFLAAAQQDTSIETLLFEPLDPARRTDSLPGDGDYTDSTYVHEDWNNHRIHTRVAFRANRMLTFLRSPQSLHGLGSVAAAAAPRYVLSLHLKYACGS
ncbi:MAG: hypothetical protein P0119_22350 [Nitrospira sp.]|nr:hypothetical protein [Nitrospira sp.]